MSGALLVLDVGTSSLKSALVGPDGSVSAERQIAYGTRSPLPGRQEQDPEDWWRALEAVCEGLAPEAVVLTGTMQNCIPTGADGRPAGPAILYSDGRVRELGAFRARMPADHEARMGNVADAAQTVWKLMSGEAAGARGVHVGAKDPLVERLTGERVTDPTTAATSGLMALATRDWDDELLAAAGVERGRLPRIVPADTVVGRTREGPLPAGIPVVCGCGDAAASLWGVGAEAPGVRSAYLGTSGWVAATVAVPDAPRPHYTLAAPVGELAVAIAPVLTAGGALEWAAARLGLPISKALAVEEGRREPPLFLPYLIGERSPFEDRAVRGALLGLDAAHDGADLMRGAVEGIAHALRHASETMEAEGPLVLTGGAGEAPLMRRALARAFGVEVRRSARPRLATALGAARIGWRALGVEVEAPLAPEVDAPDEGSRARAAIRYRAYREASGMARRLAATLGEGRDA